MDFYDYGLNKNAVRKTINRSVCINNHGYQGCLLLFSSVCKKNIMSV